MPQNSSTIARFIAGLIILLPVWTPCAAQTELAKSAGDLKVLTSTQPVESDMTTGDNHTLKVHLEARQYVRVVIEQIRIDIIITVLDPDGAKLLEVDSPVGPYGPEYVSLIAEKPGDYLLQLRTTTGRSNNGRYSASIETLRNATPEDKENATAEKTFALGRQLFILGESRTEPNQKKRREEALEKFEEVRSYWAGKKMVRWEALALYSLGATHRRLSHFKEAAEFFRKALDLSPRFDARDWRLTATILNDCGLNYTRLAEYSLAVEFLSRALKMFRDHDDRRGEGSALINTVIAEYSSNRFREGLSHLERARQLRIEEKDQAGEANVLNLMGSGYYNLGEPHRAFPYHEKSLQIINNMPAAEQARSGNALGAALNGIALIYHTFGQWQLAIDNYSQAFKIFEKSDTNLAVRTQNNLGKLYYDIGNSAKALEELDVALKLSEKIGDPTTTAEVLINLGEVKASQREKSTALGYFIRARDLGPTDRVRAGALTNIGSIKMLQNERPAAIDSFNEALKLNQKIENIEGEVTVLLRRGEAYLRFGEKTAAFEDFKQALARANTIAAQPEKINALYGLARVERELNELNSALAHSKEALELIESQRSKVPGQQLRTSYFSNQVGHYELFIDLAMSQYRITNSNSFLTAALEASERARARELIDLLTEGKVDLRKGVDPVLLKQQDEVQQKLNAKAQAQTQLLNGKHTEEQARISGKEIADLLDEYNILKTRIRESSLAYAQLTQAQSLSFSEIQQLLDDETLLIEYFVGEEKSYLWLVSRTSVIGDTLPKRSEIENRATAFSEALANLKSSVNDTRSGGARRKDPAASLPVDRVALSQLLLGPIADKIGTKRLIIVGDGVLHYLPFGALPSPVSTSVGSQKSVQSARTPYLIEEHEIVYLPSASVVPVLRVETAGRKPAPLSAAVLANPVFTSDDERLKAARPTPTTNGVTTTQKDSTSKRGNGETTRSGLVLAPLPATELEAEAIDKLMRNHGRTKIAKGFEASRTTVMELQEKQYRIIHFATHGDLDTEHPELSSIVLSLFDSEGRPQDGYLRLHDIYNLKLPTDLIVLSACRTGLGQVIKGEGLIGLTRGFMHAGSPRVVASLWQVEDLGTSELMKRIYQHIIREGMAPASAMRQAQIEMLQSKRWKSPYFWAGFVLQGEWSAIPLTH
jgi:CHAT domain-containing protein/predicted negative regulator of RcsB-dependent stress response